jgi:hypothetical protein
MKLSDVLKLEAIIEQGTLNGDTRAVENLCQSVRLRLHFQGEMNRRMSS